MNNGIFLTPEEVPLVADYLNRRQVNGEDMLIVRRALGKIRTGADNIRATKTRPNTDAAGTTYCFTATEVKDLNRIIEGDAHVIPVRRLNALCEKMEKLADGIE